MSFNITYIGKGGSGETSRMRFDCLREILPDAHFTLIDVSIPERECGRLVRSFGWRFKAGPMIGRINRYVQAHLPQERQQLIWVDKAAFITPATTHVLRQRAEKLVHFTPDMAFFSNPSKMFEASIPDYDFLITSKTCEIELYRKLTEGTRAKLLLTTQGFRKDLHRPVASFQEKEGIVFIGLCEPSREMVIDRLLETGIRITIAGNGWESFVKKHPGGNLQYLGRGLFAEEYVRTISHALFSWGALSKKFPEQHTTRTFEIPACGTALLTEKNDEIASFYKDDEVIFYSSIDDMIEKIRYYMVHTDELKALTERGHHAVIAGGFDYVSIVKKLLREMEIPC